MSLPVLAVGGGLLAVVSRRLPLLEARILTLSFGAHLVSSIAQVFITRDYFGGGDMFAYWYHGSEAAEFLRRNFSDAAPEYLAMFFRQTTETPVPSILGGPSTQSMFVVAAFLLFLLNGSIHASTLFIATLACFGKFLTYRALRPWLPAEHQRRALIALMLIPSAVYWSSGLLKESVVSSALGVLLLCVSWIVRGRRLILGGVLGGASALVVSMIKGYMLFPFVLGAAALWYWNRQASLDKRIALRPAYLLAALGVAFGGVIMLGRAMPEYSVDRLGEEIALHQERGQRTAGGSNYQLGEVAEERSLTAQVAYAPLALLTALFRPMLFEARNVMMLLSALESTLLLWLFLKALWRDSPRGVLRGALGSPAMAFSLAFVLVLSVAVGLSTTNLGTLSRYRAPMLPFLGLLVLTLAAPKPSPDRAGASATRQLA